VTLHPSVTAAFDIDLAWNQFTTTIQRRVFFWVIRSAATSGRKPIPTSSGHSFSSCTDTSYRHIIYAHQGPLGMAFSLSHQRLPIVKSTAAPALCGDAKWEAFHFSLFTHHSQLTAIGVANEGGVCTSVGSPRIGIPYVRSFATFRLPE
jgi:hypothetical protein